MCHIRKRCTGGALDRLGEGRARGLLLPVCLRDLLTAPHTLTLTNSLSFSLSLPLTLSLTHKRFTSRYLFHSHSLSLSLSHTHIHACGLSASMIYQIDLSTAFTSLFFSLVHSLILSRALSLALRLLLPACFDYMPLHYPRVDTRQSQKSIPRTYGGAERQNKISTTCHVVNGSNCGTQLLVEESRVALARELQHHC